MSECGWLSDRIPAVALGRAEWTPEEVGHLNGCRECQQEWNVVRAASHLGEGVAAPDPEALAVAVLRRLRRDRETGRQRRRAGGLAGFAAAAAVAAAVWTGGNDIRTEQLPQTRPIVAGRLAIPLPELESLQPAELDSVLQTVDEPNGGGSHSDEPDLRDLNADELERVLDSWEG